MRFKIRGFTLIELMITVLVVSILAAIAIPSYRANALRSRRTDATAALMRVQTAEEKFFLQYNAYTNDIVNVAPAGLGFGSNSSQSGYYQVAVALTALGFTAQATPIAGQGQEGDAKCATFSIDQNGNRTATGTDSNPNQNCWR